MRLYLQKPVMILTVRENQLYEALVELKNNKSNTIVTMINSLDSYNKWENIVGKGRIYKTYHAEAENKIWLTNQIKVT